MLHAGKWLALLPVLFAVWEGLTAKTAVLPVPFFAPPQALIEVLHDDWPRLVGPHEFQRHPLPRPCLAVEDDQGAGGSLAAKVDGLRQLGLAHLLFPSQQDGALSPGRLAGVAQQFAHGA